MQLGQTEVLPWVAAGAVSWQFPLTMKRRNYWRLVLTLFVLGTFVVIMWRWFEHSQVYHPSRNMAGTGAELGRPFENVFFETSDGVKLNGWYFPATTNSSDTPVTLLICHGNAGNISHRLGLCRLLLDMQANVFVFDYRGYGLSEGHPTETGTYGDATAAFQWLQRRGCKQIIVYGESLGGAVAAEVCLHERASGLILQSTFTSIVDIGKEFFPWLPVRWLSTIHYDTLSKLPRIHAPVLVMHSRVDGLIPFRHGERNFAAANEPKLFWEISGGHNDSLLDEARFRKGIAKFLDLVQGGEGKIIGARSLDERQAR